MGSKASRISKRRHQFRQRELRDLAHTVSSLAQSVDFEYPDSTTIPHALFSDTCDERVVFAKRDPLDSRRKLPIEQAFACLDVPELHSIVCRARHEKPGFR
jgi:hypothetical protein